MRDTPPSRFALVVVAGALAAGCGAANEPPPVVPAPPQAPLAPVAPRTLAPPSKATLDAFAEGYADIRRHDLAGDWSLAECARIGRKLAVVPAQERPLAEAVYASGIAFSRCGSDVEAATQFRAALAVDPRFAPARVEVAVLKAEADGNVDAAIGTLENVVLDSQYQSTDALINLSRMLRRRASSPATGPTCTTRKGGTPAVVDDLECARLNAQRAVAIDESSAPATNELAMVYVARGLYDVALLLGDEATRRYPRFAPLHVTTGLAHAAKGEHAAALRAFDAARKLDPGSFDAQMSYAGASVTIHDFANAEAAYGQALLLRPDDYGAHLGLALALRGLLTQASVDSQIDRVQGELDACRGLDAGRPDAWYNAAILTEDFKASRAGGKDRTLATLAEARSLFATFLDKAAGKPRYAGAVARARQRMQEIDDVVAFLKAP
jgi:tetratricopeptide (TPR) repeat protein